ncbi:phage tail protein [Proteus vulgaris]|uniref:phage tail-collar fiber domain-containing protein n=1 Tax=Proteus vulgaris TaxID=585 RepID=UPI002541C2B0|nr:phage tail protein [Proteus vulgaris]WIF70672.1 phage tail protein [Proteus vulgaris]
MSQSAITLAFERWKASATEAQQPVILDEFVLANVPDLDPSKPIDRNEGLPDAKYIMHRQAVNKTGVVNQNAVAYSVTVGAEIGDFDFNWIGLLNKKSGTVAMIVHAPTQRKIKTQAGQQGNVLTRSFLLEYLGASKETAINTPAEMWQIDFTARLSGIDEMQRLVNTDNYGEASFFGDAFLVGKTGNQYFVTKGIGYIGGLRAELTSNKNITVPAENTKVYADVSYQGNITSRWQTQIQLTVKPDLKNTIDNAGFPHFVFAIASISADGKITDLRPKGTLDFQQLDDALKAHEKSRNHPDATTAVKGFTKLDNQVGDSQTTALTPYGAKKELENYQPKGNYQPAGSYVTTSTFNLEINKKIDKANISQQLANDVNKVPSLDLLTKELGKKQASGNYADKSKTAIQLFSGGVRAPYVDAIQGGLYVGLRAFNETPSLYISNKGIGYNIYIPLVSGTLALESYGYSKTESNLKFQPTGNYADKTTKYTQKFESALEVTGEVQSSTGDIRLAIKTASNVPTIVVKYGASGVWKVINVPDKSGTMALVGESYTTTQSDNKYQLKGNYADKSSASQQSFAGAISSPSSIITTSEVGELSLNVTREEPLILYRKKLGRWNYIKLQEKDGVVAYLSDIEEANIYPWGVLIPWCGATAPNWALVANGSAFNKTTYSKLGQFFPSGRLPDARANVLRGLDAGRGIDTGRTILSEQMGNSLLSSNIFGGLGAEGDKNWRRVIDYIGISGTDNDGGYGVYQQKEGVNGQETRMRNTAVLWIVRAK